MTIRRLPGQLGASVIAALVVCASLVPLKASLTQPTEQQSPLPSPNIEVLMTRVGELIAASYRQARRVLVIEQSTVQPIGANWAPEGFARTVESELRVEYESADGSAVSLPTVTRSVRKVNGHDPSERDQKSRSGCTDPNPLSPEPLAFLLPEQQSETRFTSVRDGKEGGRAALVIDFMSVIRKTSLELVEDERGHDDCFDWKGPQATRGRVWIDAKTHDVLRVDRRLEGLVDVHVPQLLQRRHGFEPWVVLERDDVTMRYKAVTFRDPDERILLPQSIESLTLVRRSLQSVRRTDVYSNYRRFLGTGRIGGKLINDGN
jgi:hypothetical protein